MLIQCIYASNTGDVVCSGSLHGGGNVSPLARMAVRASDDVHFPVCREACRYVLLWKGHTLGDKIKPLGDRVVLEASEKEETTRSGIVLPDTAKEKPQEGTIIAAGPGRRLDSGELVALEVKVGDKVLYAKYAGTEVKLDGKEYLIVREADILAVMA